MLLNRPGSWYQFCWIFSYKEHFEFGACRMLKKDFGRYIQTTLKMHNSFQGNFVFYISGHLMFQTVWFNCEVLRVWYISWLEVPTSNKMPGNMTKLYYLETFKSVFRSCHRRWSIKKGALKINNSKKCS